MDLVLKLIKAMIHFYVFFKVEGNFASKVDIFDEIKLPVKTQENNQIEAWGVILDKHKPSHPIWNLESSSKGLAMFVPKLSSLFKTLTILPNPPTKPMRKYWLSVYHILR